MKFIRKKIRKEEEKLNESVFKDVTVKQEDNLSNQEKLVRSAQKYFFKELGAFLNSIVKADRNKLHLVPKTTIFMPPMRGLGWTFGNYSSHSKGIPEIIIKKIDTNSGEILIDYDLGYIIEDANMYYELWDAKRVIGINMDKILIGSSNETYSKEKLEQLFNDRLKNILNFKRMRFVFGWDCLKNKESVILTSRESNNKNESYRNFLLSNNMRIVVDKIIIHVSPKGLMFKAVVSDSRFYTSFINDRNEYWDKLEKIDYDPKIHRNIDNPDGEDYVALSKNDRMMFDLWERAREEKMMNDIQDNIKFYCTPEKAREAIDKLGIVFDTSQGEVYFRDYNKDIRILKTGAKVNKKFDN